MLNRLSILVCTILVASGCKYRPNQVRSTLQTKNIYQFVKEGSVRFYRNADETKSELQFELLEDFECMVSFWSEDTNVQPNVSAPLNRACTKGDRSITMTFDDLRPGTPYAVKISIWPRRLSSLTSANLILREGEDLKDVNSNSIIVGNFVTPRLSGEIYNYAFNGSKSLQEVRGEIVSAYNERIGCSDKRQKRPQPFSLNTTATNEQTESFANIKQISSDGYGIGRSKNHRFHENRLVHNFESADNGQEISWFFSWIDNKFQFRTSPPVRINQVEVRTADSRYRINYRSLKEVPPIVESGRLSPTISIDYLYAGDLNYVNVTVQAKDNPEQGIFCTFTGDQSVYTIDSELYSNLSAGDYEIIVTVEAIQLHYESPPRYPPWVISHQDWIHSRLTKVL